MWKCDVCGQNIERAEDGWVEAWSYRDPATGKGGDRDLRLVHAYTASPRGPGGCQFNEEVELAKGRVGCPADVSLADLLGKDGLKRLRATFKAAPQAELERLIKLLHPASSS